MTGDDILADLLARIAASREAVVYISSDELVSWPKRAVAALKGSRLLIAAAPAANVTCDGCEQGCSMPVDVFNHNGRAAAFVSCEEHDYITQVNVPLVRLERWQTSGEAAAGALAQLLAIPRPPGVIVQSSRWPVGILRDRHAAHVELAVMSNSLMLNLAGHSVELSDVLAVKHGQLSLDREILLRCVNHPLAGGGTEASAAERGADVAKMAKEIGVKATAERHNLSQTRIKQITAAHRKRKAAGKI